LVLSQDFEIKDNLRAKDKSEMMCKCIKINIAEKLKLNFQEKA
jgi:hypothetical protein